MMAVNMFRLSRDPGSFQVVLRVGDEEPVLLPLVSKADFRLCEPWWSYEVETVPPEISFLLSYESSSNVPVPAHGYEIFDHRKMEERLTISYVRTTIAGTTFTKQVQMKWLHVFSLLPGYHPVVQVLLLAQGTDPNSIDNSLGRTPLHMASTEDTAKLLLNSNARLNVRDCNGCTPLHVATGCDRRSLVELLLVNGADPNIADTNGRSPLHESRSAETAQLLTEKKAKVNLKDRYRKTPLLIATKEDRHSVVQVLLAHGADPNIRDYKKQSPLHKARSATSVKLLIEKKAKVNVKDMRGKTPLSIAIESNLHSVVQVLLANGADLFIADNTGKTPLSKAKSDRMILTFIHASGDVNYQYPGDEKTLLHYYCEDGNEEAVKILLRAENARQDIRNKKGETALDIALAKGYVHIATHFPGLPHFPLSSTGRFEREFEIVKDEEHKDGVLGKGTLGRVFKARRKATEDLYAIKETPIAFGEAEKTLRDLRTTMQLSREHSGSLDCYDAWIENRRTSDETQHPSRAQSGESENVSQGAQRGRRQYLEKCTLMLYIQMELMDLTLETYIRTRNEEYLSQKCRTLNDKDQWAVSSIFWELCWTVHSIHESGFIHRDLKPSNVLLSMHSEPYECPYSVRVSHLGLSRQEVDEFGTEIVSYAPPEQTKGEAGSTSESGTNGKAVDVYSLALIAVELMMPMSANEGPQVFNDLRSSDVRFPKEVKESFKRQQLELLRRAFSHEPIQRPNAGELKTLLL